MVAHSEYAGGGQQSRCFVVVFVTSLETRRVAGLNDGSKTAGALLLMQPGDLTRPLCAVAEGGVVTTSAQVARVSLRTCAHSISGGRKKSARQHGSRGMCTAKRRPPTQCHTNEESNPYPITARDELLHCLGKKTPSSPHRDAGGSLWQRPATVEFQHSWASQWRPQFRGGRAPSGLRDQRVTNQADEARLQWRWPRSRCCSRSCICRGQGTSEFFRSGHGATEG